MHVATLEAAGLVVCTAARPGEVAPPQSRTDQRHLRAWISRYERGGCPRSPALKAALEEESP
jgi:hypothetical protein